MKLRVNKVPAISVLYSHGNDRPVSETTTTTTTITTTSTTTNTLPSLHERLRSTFNLHDYYLTLS